MKIGLKLSIAFCIAAIFLLAVEVVAVVVVVRLNEILKEVNHHNMQIDQVAKAITGIRDAPTKTAEHLARLDDMEKWATSEHELGLIADIRRQLNSGASPNAVANHLDTLGVYYRNANETAHNRLVSIHERVVLGLVAIMISSILLVTLLTFLVRTWLLNPVQDLSERLARIAAGDWLVRIIPRGGAEFEGIATTVSDITAAHRESLARIERAERLAALGEACSHVTHNLRNQLASIRSLAQYESRATGVDAEARVGFNYIIATVNKLDNWVRDLLGSVHPLEPRPVQQPLEPIIQDTVAMLEPRLTDKNLRIEFRPAEGVPSIPVDRSLFEQAFAAVLTNAIEASPEQGRIAVTTTSGANGTVVVRIEDEGPGMPAEAKQRAFEPFFTTKAEGAGLGLTIAQMIVKRHGGEIQLDSAPRKGTRVAIHLPVARPPASH